MNRLIKFTCLVLTLSIILALPVAAAVAEDAPYSSRYFGSHSTYLVNVSTSSFQVWFDVTAVSTMTQLGVDSIDIERSSDGVNWSVVKTYTRSSYSNLIGSNTADHCSYVTYSNKQSGYQYRAYVEFYAKNSSGSAKSGAYAYF